MTNIINPIYKFMQLNFKLYMEGSRFPYAYHITYLKNIDDIAQTQLRARGGFSAWRKPHLNQHSEKGIFFCRDKRCILRWIEEMAEQAYNLSDNPIDDQLIPIILRFNVNRNSINPDKLANAEHLTKQNFYTTKQINPIGIQMWNGYEWTDLDINNVNINTFINMQGYEAEAEILHGREYPMPEIL